MNAEAGIQDSIRGSRKMSEDGKKVVYNLSKNIDFSDIKSIAKVLSTIFFQEDVSKWYVEEKGDMVFKPRYSAEIILPKDQARKAEKTMVQFLKDLRDGDIAQNFKKYIEKYQDYKAGITSTIMLGFLGALAWEKMANKGVKKDYLADIVDEIIGNIKIVEV